MAKKRFACCAAEREKECDHPAGFVLMSRVPRMRQQVCRVCHLCGLTREQAEAESVVLTEGEVKAKRELRAEMKNRLHNLRLRSRNLEDQQRDWKTKQGRIDAEIAVCRLALESLGPEAEPG